MRYARRSALRHPSEMARSAADPEKPVSVSNLSRAAGALLASIAIAAMVNGCSPAASNGAASSAQSPLGGLLQPASVAGTGMTSFTDPSENAFTVSVPQGWTVTGGIQRSPGQVRPWLTATSPDGATVITYGDASIPMFQLPGPNGGGQAYENGLQFATDFAQRAYGSTCTGLTPAGSQAEPALTQATAALGAQAAAQMGAPGPNPSAFDGASETFTCQTGGVADAIGVIDVTYDYPTNVGGFWNVPVLIAYRTPAASQAQTDQLARAIKASFQTNAQWQAQQLTAAKQQMASNQQQGAVAIGALTAQEGAESQMLNNQEAINNARLNAAHAQTMNWLNAQGQRIDQNFANQQAAKASGQQAEMRYINNQQCIRWNDAAHTSCAATAPY
jgi:hypothetical protein